MRSTTLVKKSSVSCMQTDIIDNEQSLTVVAGHNKEPLEQNIYTEGGK